MILRGTKFKHRKMEHGVTLIECLAVITIMAGLVAGVAASFVLTLKSYVGEYRAEAIELESQRAALELEYYVARSWRIDVMDGGSSGSEGYQVDLYQPNGVVVSFVYTPTGVSGSNQVGSLSINMPSISYLYSQNILFQANATSTRPFWITPDGSLGFRWSVDTPSGPVMIGGSTLPDI